ncbi:hypothetical protein N7510_000666 [Penicillium lagena]|uniref:uncharacterized protein n=1 Tax=Penicillium lagena TaxID=94218 RepID=UPI002541244D|nr:uncharacterized protein N7510_000666 [Penicillium lagena]KAJ5624357.1 hypothetical protein N7510_000666 [Penicillium lagena]
MKGDRRRSAVHSLNGIVACTQPLAAIAGQTILKQGGNAADAGIAVAACLNVTEPWSTGIGGDIFCLFYDGQTKKVHGLNGSGRAPARITLEEVRGKLNIPDNKPGSIPLNSIYAVTVPGAAAGWIDTVERFGSGKLSMQQILQPAVDLAEKGFPVSEISAYYWQENEQQLREASPNFKEMLKEDIATADGSRAPRTGEIMKMPTLANTFHQLAIEGKKGFYAGRVADAICQVMQDRGGHLTYEDLEYHARKGSEYVRPMSLRFKSIQSSVDVWEHPPNGQGIVALMALGIIQELQKSGKITQIPSHNSDEYLHLIVESLRIAFADGTWFISDPHFHPIPDLLSPSYLSTRARLFNPEHASTLLDHGSPALRSSDTVYFAVTDYAGNAVSIVNSNYHGFGSGIIPAKCGFTLQSRGANFSLAPGHPNCLAPGKRPYHTIIPGLATNAETGGLHSVFGVMGAFMQPQGHVQVLLNMLAFGMSPQEALDAPRVCIASVLSNGEAVDGTVYVEEGISEEAIQGLERRGHHVRMRSGWQRDIFGRGQIIRNIVDGEQRVYTAGSDPRGDGMAVPV